MKYSNFLNLAALCLKFKPLMLYLCRDNTFLSTGEVIVLKRGSVTPDDNTASDIDDIVKRLTCTSDGCEVDTILYT